MPINLLKIDNDILSISLILIRYDLMTTCVVCYSALKSNIALFINNNYNCECYKGNLVCDKCYVTSQPKLPEKCIICRTPYKDPELDLIKSDGMHLKLLSQQRENICLEAVKQNGLALEFVNNKTIKICLSAINQNPMALVHVNISDFQDNEDDKYEKICLIAVRKNGMALKYVNNKTHKICLEAVRQNGMALQFVNHQTYGICNAAIRQNKLAVDYVSDHIDEMHNDYMDTVSSCVGVVLFSVLCPFL